MRRSGTLFTLFVAVFIVMVFVAMQFAPRPYNWEESFSPRDAQPFGSLLFDSLMCASMPNGYEVKNMSVYACSKENKTGRHNLLLVTKKDYSLPEADCKAMLDMARRGDNVMWVCASPDALADSLGYRVWNSRWFDYQEIKAEIKNYGHALCDTLFLPESEDYPACEIPVLSSMFGCSLDCEDVGYDYEALAAYPVWDNIEDAYCYTPVAIRVRYGRGNIYIVTAALCFTNYGMLDPHCRTFVLRMMNELSEYPVVRLYEPDEDEEYYGAYGPLDFVYRNDCLRLAWQLFLAGAVLLLVVNARRRQRAIPLWEKSVNATADFLNQHASLYRKRTDHAPLLKRRYRAFSAELQRLWRVDVGETSPALWREEVRRLASCLGRPVSEVMSDLEELEVLRNWSEPVSPKMFRNAMELMQKLTPKQ